MTVAKAFHPFGVEQGLTGASLGSPWFSCASLEKQKPWPLSATHGCDGARYE